MRSLSSFVTALNLWAGVAAASASNFSSQCSSLSEKLHVPNATITLTNFVSAGTVLQFPEDGATCNSVPRNVTVNICRVALTIATSNRSSVRMEAWLPQDWSGRFLSTGNGGLGGCIAWDDIEYAVSLGFAAVGTNNGHDGTTGETFLNNPDVIEDFAYRAMHTGVTAGKTISETFYEKKHSKSYYLGCSTGGRQGFKSIQAFPGDFDGVVAGAPAFAFNNLTSWSCHFLPLTGTQGSPQFVPIDMWPTIHQDILDQCDEIDGAADGIIETTQLCKYDPSGLACKPGQNASCLTTTQLETVRKIYSPLFNKDGDFVFPRLQPGAEAAEAAFLYFRGQPFFAVDWWKYAIFNDSMWDPATLKPEDYDLSSSLNLFDIETWDGDLSAFQDRGGKVISYHGLMDGVIPSENSPRYYEHVSETMDLGSEELDDFYRLFQISGMTHCSGGPGAAFIGNQRANFASLDPEENVLMAIVRWVEEGIAPETIRGTAFRNGTQNSGIDYKRRHCRWPYRNVHNGDGDWKNEDTWECTLDWS